jgi:hypothetical protein
MRMSTTPHYEDTVDISQLRYQQKVHFIFKSPKGIARYLVRLFIESHDESTYTLFFVTLSMTVDEEKLSRRWNLKAYIMFIMLLYFQMLQRLLSSVAVHD